MLIYHTVNLMTIQLVSQYQRILASNQSEASSSYIHNDPFLVLFVSQEELKRNALSVILLCIVDCYFHFRLSCVFFKRTIKKLLAHGPLRAMPRASLIICFFEFPRLIEGKQFTFYSSLRHSIRQYLQLATGNFVKIDP